MATSDDRQRAVPVGALSRFARQQNVAQSLASTPAPAVEHCELCSVAIPAMHRHLLDVSGHTVVCACNACSLLFGGEGAMSGKYRVIPTRRLALPDFNVTDEQWDELMLPVNMVYIFYSSEAKRVVAYYPSPAGAMESLLNLESWQMLVENNPVLSELEPDVEALLINRVRGGREHYIVPIDTCYQLTGLIRSLWRGLSGGEEVWNAIAAFFQDIQTRASINKP